MAVLALALLWARAALALDGYAIPNASFDTDDGFGAGARGELAWPSERPDQPYRLSLVAQGYVATSGYQHHRFRLDRPGFGPNGRGRATLHVAWRQWLSDRYFGIGDRTLRERAYTGSFDRDDPDRRYYRYALVQPFVHLTLRHQLGSSPAELFVAFNPKYSRVLAYPGSLLEAEHPYGTAGGPTVQGFLGLLHDTRSPEIAPRKGHLAELSGRFAPDLGGEAGGFGGLLASARGYASLDGRTVLAGRLMAEQLAGAVPFYEMVHWGGAIPVAGFGGAETLRGVSFGRWRSDGKAVANLELRWSALSLRFRDDPLVIELAPYADVGTVWGRSGPGAAGGPPIHPAAGGGVRLVYAGTFVGRLDTAVAPDPVLEPDGRVTSPLGWGFYLTFDHMY